MSDSKTSDAISRSAVLDIINEERRFIESLRETAYDNEDRAHNTGELGCAIRLARKIKELPALDVAPVVHARWVTQGIEVYCTHCMMPQDDGTNYCPYCGAKMDALSNFLDKNVGKLGGVINAK